VFWERDYPFGFFALAAGLAVSLLFCRFAYSRQIRTRQTARSGD